jgi:hypothetical protein
MVLISTIKDDYPAYVGVYFRWVALLTNVRNEGNGVAPGLGVKLRIGQLTSLETKAAGTN